VPTMESVHAGEGLFACFKGEPGTRKSTSALSFPGKQFWASYDQKMNGLLIPMKNWGIDPKNVEYEDYDAWEPFRDKLERLIVNCPYNDIIVDSVTSMADATVRGVVNTKSTDKKGKRIAGIPVAGFEDFNAESSAISEMIALLKSIRRSHHTNIILIAHVIQVDYKDAAGETHVSRTLVTAAKKIAAKIPAYCDEVYHFNIKSGFEVGKGGQYALLTEHTGQDFARTSLPLPKEIIFGNEPLYDKWIKPAIQQLTNQPQTVRIGA
jgi:AAA domain